MEQEFDGLTAIVTGAGSGIGLEVAKGLTSKGAKVFGFDINEGQMGSNATFIKCDIGDSTSVKNAFEEFKKSSNKLDILINNAGIGSLTTVEKESDEVWQKVLNINVVGTARVSREAIPLLRNSKSAAIVNTASVEAILSSYSRISGGTVILLIRRREPASSIKSIALSGRNGITITDHEFVEQKNKTHPKKYCESNYLTRRFYD